MGSGGCARGECAYACACACDFVTDGLDSMNANMLDTTLGEGC